MDECLQVTVQNTSREQVLRSGVEVGTDCVLSPYMEDRDMKDVDSGVGGIKMDVGSRWEVKEVAAIRIWQKIKEANGNGGLEGVIVVIGVCSPKV